MMSEENISQEFRLKNVDETRNYFIEEIKMNWYVRSIKKFAEFWIILKTCIIILVSTVTRCFSISAFAPVVGIPIEIMSSAVGLKICVITARIKKY